MSSGSFAFAWFHSGGVGCLPVHSVARWFTPARLGVVARSVGFHSGAPSDLPVHPGSRWFTSARNGVAGFIQVPVASVKRAEESSGSFGCA